MGNNNEEKTTIREVLYEYLKAKSSIDRWHQPFFDWQDAAQALGVQDIGDLEKPYGVIVFPGESNSPNRAGWFQELEVWPYFLPGNFLQVDAAVEEIVGLLNGKEIGHENRLYRVEYLGAAGDYYDARLRAYTRRVDFRVPKVRR